MVSHNTVIRRILEDAKLLHQQTSEPLCHCIFDVGERLYGNVADNVWHICHRARVDLESYIARQMDCQFTLSHRILVEHGYTLTSDQLWSCRQAWFDKLLEHYNEL